MKHLIMTYMVKTQVYLPENELRELNRLAKRKGRRMADLAEAWRYFDRSNLHKLSLVDATSFALMVKHRLRTAFTFNSHFALAGFRCMG